MKITTWKYTTNIDGESFDVPSATLSTTRWARRRSFPIRIVSVTERSVSVELGAPTTGHHNRAVNSLGNILTRQLERRAHRLANAYTIPSYTVARTTNH